MYSLYEYNEQMLLGHNIFKVNAKTLLMFTMEDRRGRRDCNTIYLRFLL